MNVNFEDMAEMGDVELYEVLGVDRKAKESDIKKAYEKKVEEYISNLDPEATDKLISVEGAWEVLGDADMRKVYDEGGMDAVRQAEAAHHHDDEDDDDGHADGMDPFGGLFGGLMGGPFGFGGSRMGGMMGGMMGGRGRRQRCEDIIEPLSVTLSDLYKGKHCEVEVTRSVVCLGCGGAGGAEGAMEKCKGCRGQGIKIVHRQIGPGMIQQMQAVCNDCNGSGELMNEKDRCKQCLGKRVISETRKVGVEVERGMRGGQKLVMEGEGNRSHNADTSDLILVLQLTEHETFKRSGDDLTMVKEISITEALCGVDVMIEHLDERKLIIRNPPGSVIHPGDMRCIDGEGMPRYRDPSSKGNLYIRFEVTFPSNRFLEGDGLGALEALLPPRPPVVVPEGEHVEEVNLNDYDMRRGDENRTNHQHDEDDDDDDDEGGGAHGMQCAQQ